MRGCYRSLLKCPSNVDKNNTLLTQVGFLPSHYQLRNVQSKAGHICLVLYHREICKYAYL